MCVRICDDIVSSASTPQIIKEDQETIMQEWVLNIVNQFGYVGVAFLIFFENVFPPIPSEVILTFAGFMSTYTSLTPPLLIVAATMGSLLGAIVLYGVGRCLSPERLECLLSGKIGRVLHLKSENLKTAMDCFLKQGKRTVFLCRCAPLLRSLISIPAGMSHMNMGAFLIYTTLGTLLWNTVLIYAGVLAGRSWERIVSVMDKLSAVILVVLLSCTVWLVFFCFRRRQK